jgi:hypothetical protein
MSQVSVYDESMSKAQLQALGEEIATFAARIDVATHALITRLRQFDAHEGHAYAELATCAHWLSWRTGIGLNAAREKVRVARALGELPRIDKLFSRGELSYSKVRAITRVATPETEQDFIDIALHATAAQIERLARAYERTREDEDDTIPKPRRYVRRSKTFRGMERIEMQLPPEEAAIVWDALMSAMDAGGKSGDAARDASNLESTGAGASEDGMNGSEAPALGSTGEATDVTAGTSEHASSEGATNGSEEDGSATEASDVSAERSEAVGARSGAPAAASQRDVTREHEVAGASTGSSPDARGHRAANAAACASESAAGPAGRPSRVTAEVRDAEDKCPEDGAGPAGGSASKNGHAHADGCCAGAPMLPANDGQEQEEARADAMVDLARAYLRTRPRTLGSGYELVIITTQERLEAGGSTAGAIMRDGTPLPLDVARMLACDSARVNMTADQSGAMLDVGRSTRTIPPAIARALWVRDGCCRVPGCGRRRHLQAHHIEHWVDGGPTCMGNLMLVCSYHHKCLHDGRLFVEVRDGKLVFLDAQGRERPAAPPSAATGEELEALERFLQDADLHIDPSVNEPRWDGTRLDMDEALAWMSVADQTRTAAPG